MSLQKLGQNMAKNEKPYFVSIEKGLKAIKTTNYLLKILFIFNWDFVKLGKSGNEKCYGDNNLTKRQEQLKLG